MRFLIKKFLKESTFLPEEAGEHQNLSKCELNSAHKNRKTAIFNGNF
jgi:hypothetical protein